jgi:hypothetical protein
MNADITVHTNHCLNSNAAPTCLGVSIFDGLDKSDFVLKAIEAIYTDKIRKVKFQNRLEKTGKNVRARL